YITGRTNGTLGTSSQGGFDAYVRKYNASGNVVWTTQFGSNTTDAAYTIAVNASGVYVGGETAGDFPGFTKVPSGLYDAFAAKLDLNGVQQWVRQFGSRYEDKVFGAAATTTGIYFVGYAGDPLP